MPHTGWSSTLSMRSDSVSPLSSPMPTSDSTCAAHSKRSSLRERTHCRIVRPATGRSARPRGIGVPDSSAPAIASANSSQPSPTRPSTATTGTPSKARCNRAASTGVPCLAARSVIVSATTVGLPSSSTWARKYSERDRFVASIAATMRSGCGCPFAPVAASTATSSSGDMGSSEYVPGVSVKSHSCVGAAVPPCRGT